MYMPKKILVIDDDMDILEALKELLEIFGYAVVATPRAEAALQTVEKYQPDVLLLDVLLSGNDGRVITQELRQHKSTRQLPIILISAHPSAAQSAYASGADEFVAKPFDMDTLLGTIEKHLTNNTSKKKTR